jgi:hypothetical protein
MGFSVAALVSFAKSPFAWALIALVAGLVYTGVVYKKGEKTGSTEVITRVQENTQKLQGKISDAEAAAPRTPHDVSRRLRSGDF